MKFNGKDSDSTSKIAQNQIYEFDSFLLDSLRRRLLLNGEIIPLTTKLFDILLLLVGNSGKIITKELIMREIWQNQFVEDNNLTVSISMLRKVLGEKYGERKYIETVPKYGYRFAAIVTEREYREIRVDRGNDSDRKSESNGSIKSLAVLPLINATGNENLNYLSDGLTQGIIISLSQISNVRVLAHSITVRYQNSDLDARRIGEELNVETILLGKISSLDDNLLIGIELIDSQTGFLLFGNSYELILSDLLKLQNQIIMETSKKIVSKLPKDLNEKFPVKNYTENSDAYLLYLKGRYFMAKRNIKSLQTAIEFFDRAILLDENYSLAYSGLADCYSTLVIYGYFSPRELIPKAKKAAEKAMEIDDSLAEAHTSLAKIKVNFDWDWEGSEKHYQKAIEINPQYAPAYGWYADYLARVGLFDKAIDTVNMALEIEPFSLFFHKAKIFILYLARRYDKAIGQCAEALEIEPNQGQFIGLLAYIYNEQQKYEEAALALEKFVDLITGDYEISPPDELKSKQNSRKKFVSLQSDPEAIGSLGYTYAKAGKINEALELVERLNELAKYRYVEPHTLAMIYIGLGNFDRAFEWLERAFTDRSPILTFLKVWSLFDPIRSDPRFADLCKRVNFGKNYEQS